MYVEGPFLLDQIDSRVQLTSSFDKCTKLVVVYLFSCQIPGI